MMPIHLSNLGLLLVIRYNLWDKIYHLRQVRIPAYNQASNLSQLLLEIELLFP